MSDDESLCGVATSVDMMILMNDDDDAYSTVYDMMYLCRLCCSVLYLLYEIEREAVE
jgi:hypothetical protein